MDIRALFKYLQTNIMNADLHNFSLLDTANSRGLAMAGAGPVPGGDITSQCRTLSAASTPGLSPGVILNGKMKFVITAFRANLRLLHNPTLDRAIARANEIG